MTTGPTQRLHHHGATAPSRRDPRAQADALAAAVQSAAQRGDARELGRLEAGVLALARSASADAGVADLALLVPRAWARCRRYERALAAAEQLHGILGFDPLASPELQLRLSMGDASGARAAAEALADGPVAAGGHGLRAIVRELLGRHADAAADGARFVEEALAVHRSLPAWREAARRYTPDVLPLMAQFGAACAELERAFPGIERWRGEPLHGRTVALQLIEGYGDQIQALRFARTIRAMGGRLVVGCDEPLVELVRASGLADGFLPRPLATGELRPDLYLVVGGRLHESGLDPALWGPAPYLDLPDNEAGEPEALEGLGRPRVGIVWAGKPTFALEPLRALPYEALRRLVAATPNVAWVSLLVGDHPRARELRSTPVTRRVRDAGPAIGSFLDTARLMRGLDLVVCTDSAPAHLAGALGVPTWLLLGSAADWRWGLEGERTPLYPSVRLVRDGATGSWNAAVDHVARELRAWTPGAAGDPPPYAASDRPAAATAPAPRRS